jgi:hypothetical protein
MSDDRPASVADIVVEEESNGPIRLPKMDFFTRGQKLRVKDPGTFSPATIWNSPACRHVSVCACDAGVVRQASNDCAANKFGRWLPDCNHSADDFIGEQRKNADAGRVLPMAIFLIWLAVAEAIYVANFGYAAPTKAARRSRSSYPGPA